jgi:hypothetical protein
MAVVTKVAPNGFWLLLGTEELPVPYEHCPWFRHATIDEIVAVERPTENHLYWPRLDIDLAVESLRDPAEFPLVAAGA